MKTGGKRRKVAVLVAGAHRSGTSAFTRVLSLLGCALPRTLLPANAGNEAGYWESERVTRLNDEILALAGGNWRSWRPLRKDWLRQPQVRALRAQALSVLQSEFGDAPVFVLKDPRICRLMDFWTKVLHEFEARPVAVCPIRNPLEVASSLARRNDLAEPLGNFLWLRYTLEAERDTRLLPRVFASYDSLLKNWRPVVVRLKAGLGISWPRPPEQVARDVDAFLSGSHRHHFLSRAQLSRNFSLPVALRETYSVLHRWTREGEDRAERKLLDRFRRDLDTIPAALLPMVAAGDEQMEQARVLRKQLTKSEQESAKRDAKLQEQARQLVQTKAALEAGALSREKLQAQLTQSAESLAQRDRDLNAGARQREELSAKLDSAQQELARQGRSLIAYARALGTIRERHAQTEKRLLDRDAALEASVRRQQDLQSRLLESAQRRKELEAHVSESTQRQRDLQSRLLESAQRHKELEAQVSDSARRQQDLQSRLLESAQRRKELEAQVSEIKRERKDLLDLLVENARRREELQANLDRVTRQSNELQSKLISTQHQLEESKATTAHYGQVLNNLRERHRKSTEILATQVSKLSERDAKLKRSTATAERLARQLDNERKKTAALHQALEHSNSQAASANERAKALVNELNRIRSRPAWKFIQVLTDPVSAARLGWTALKASYREREDLSLLAGSGLFDRDWYMEAYPDVAAGGIDPARHYLRFGSAEGRDPGPGFSTHWYLKTYTDVADAGINPLLHYLLAGKSEGRDIAPSQLFHPRKNSLSEQATGATEALSISISAIPPPVWVKQAEMLRREGYFSFELCGVLLGGAASDGTADELSESLLTGPAQALVTFCRLVGLDAAQCLHCYAGDAQIDVVPTIAKSGERAGGPTCFEAVKERVHLVDIWYLNDHDLRMRFSADGMQGLVARFYQYDLAAEGQLRLAGESFVDGALCFVDLALSNPFMPVLLVLATPDGEILSTSVLPFPSLCRGGLHYGELQAADLQAGYRESLESLSRFLLEEWEQASRRSSFWVSRIGVDLQGANGAERLFSAELREWLAYVMRIRVIPITSNSSHSRALAYFEEVLSFPSAPGNSSLLDQIDNRDRNGSVTLDLSADSIPSLRAIVSSRPLALGGNVLGSFIVATDSTASPQCVVKVPPKSNELLSLQPVSAAIAFPVVRSLTRRVTTPCAELNERVPLAVRYSSRTSHPASLIMPVAPDGPQPLLRRTTILERGTLPTLSVVVHSSDPAGGTLVALVESLHLQTLATQIEIIAIVDDTAANDGKVIDGVLRRLFPGRYLLVGAGDAKFGGQINAAVERATGDFVLIIGAGVLLHDWRTLEVLCEMANCEQTASASCVLLKESKEGKGKLSLLQMGGIFPSAASNGVRPKLLQLDSSAAFPFATYPVAANSSSLMIVRRDIWRSLGGLHMDCSVHNASVDYGVRAIAAGFFHLCTSVVSAGLHDVDGNVQSADKNGEGPLQELSTEAFASVASSASVIVALKA